MSRQQNLANDSDWGWVTDPGTELGGCLTFVRDRTVEQVMKAFGMDPGAARLLPRDRAAEAADYDLANPMVRVGRSSDWTFAFEDPMLETPSAEGHTADVGLHLSAGTEAVVVSWNPMVDTVQYLADGDEVVSFEPLGAFQREGSNPDRFLREMRQAGLQTEAPDVEPADDEWFETVNPLVAALDMLTLALGIRLPREVIEGPLLTVQRRPGNQAGGMP